MDIANTNNIEPGCSNPPDKQRTTAFLDSAASITLLGMKALAKVSEVQEKNKTLGIPDGGSMETTRTLELLLPKWPAAARKGYRVPNITNNLVAVSELCDAGCTVFFTKHGVEIEFEGEVIGRGWRDQKTRLWRISITSEGGERITPSTPKEEWDPTSGIVFQATANAVHECTGKEQVARYFHASLGSHPKSTLVAAAKAGYLRGCPGFDAATISKYIDVDDATEMGHMKQTQQGARSTSTTSNRGRPKKATQQTEQELALRKMERDLAADDSESTPTQEPGNQRTNHVYMTTKRAEGFVASDQTGPFPTTSNRGNKYVCVFYLHDANHIKGVPIKNRSKSELLRAYKKVYNFCTQRGFQPKLHKLDNETSKDVEDFIRSENASYQYTPPDMHRANPAERAIQTWKAVMKSVLASLPPLFPIANWCRLCEHVDFCVNIVRKCRQNPRLSAWAAMEGEYHYDATPIAPPGSEMLLHEKPNRRRSWGFNAKKAWYLGPCFNHYRSFRGILPSTGAERVSDTVKFKHHAVAVPDLTPADRIVDAARQLETAIKQQPTKAPLDEVTAVALLRNVLLGEQTEPLPPTTVQRRKAAQRAAAAETTTTTPTPTRAEEDSPPPSTDAAYISDDEDDDVPTNHRQRRSKRVMAQMRHDDRQQLHRIACLVANETASVPDLTLKQGRGLTQGLQGANERLQFDEWAREDLFCGVIIDEDTGESLEYRDLIKLPKYREVWMKSFANEIGRLAQGIRDIKGTNTMEFIRRDEIPRERAKDVTYGRIVVSYRPQKMEPNRSRLTVGGDRINYPYDTSAPTADLPTIKMLWNSTLSTKNAKFITMDLANFYLETPLLRPEFMRLPIKLMPQEIIDKYSLNDKVSDGWVFVRIIRGMYGLPQAGLLANQLLKRRLEKRGYYECQFTPGLWRHVWRPTTFALVVDDFGVKVVGDTHANHLVKTLEKDYTVAVDWKGELFVGIKLEWDYERRILDTHVPGFVKKALHKYQHPRPKKPQHAPAKATPIKYGANNQATPHDASPRVDAARIKRIQDVVGTFAWYGRAVDPTMGATMSSIASRQSKATENLEAEVKQFLDYCHTHPNAGVRFMASDMVLCLHSDASYLSEPEGKSRAGGHFFLGYEHDETFNNGNVLTLSKIIKHVMSSASEAETAALFYNCKAAAPLRVSLAEMGHPQPPTPTTTDNSTAQGLITKSMVPKAAKSYDMRFNYLKCRQAQKQFNFIWRRGKNNRGDYHTKRHPPRHYIEKRHEYVVDMPLPPQ